jgi:hypothetical protein
MTMTLQLLKRFRKHSMGRTHTLNHDHVIPYNVLRQPLLSIDALSHPQANPSSFVVLMGGGSFLTKVMRITGFLHHHLIHLNPKYLFRSTCD